MSQPNVTTSDVPSPLKQGRKVTSTKAPKAPAKPKPSTPKRGK